MICLYIGDWDYGKALWVFEICGLPLKKKKVDVKGSESQRFVQFYAVIELHSEDNIP